MLRRRHFRILTLALLLISLLLPPALAQSSHSHTHSGAGIVNGTNGAMVSSHGESDLHMRMTPTRPATEADQATADALARAVKAGISQYADVSDAEADGYQPFPPDPSELHIVHYVNVWRSWRETWGLNPQEPGSLLYERQPDGSLQLLGAMFTAPAEATEADLSDRVPLSVTRWHLHTNICVPDPIWDSDQWALEQAGQPMFGPESPIADEASCKTVGGDFWPTAFGWMVHAYVFAENPDDVWNPMYGHDG